MEVIQTIIETSNLTKMYGRGIVGIHNATCSIPSGAVGLLGPNGAGKTTLIRTLLGIIQLTSGSASVLGHDIRTEIHEVRDRIGYMPEYTHMYVPDISAMRFVTFAGKLGGLSSNEAKQRASDTLHYVGLGEERHRQLKTFSTGMKAKVKLAIGLVHDPDIIILDEPTNGLDPEGRIQMLDLIRSLQKEEGKNVILSSHLLKDVERTTDFVVVLGNGKVISQGSLKELLKKKRDVVEVRVKNHPEMLISALNDLGHQAKLKDDKYRSSTIQIVHQVGIEQEIFKAAQRNGLEIRYLGSEATDLEEVFLSIFNETGEVHE
ncbi:MAG: ATP-binding cassette domain-containing protein [Candidatus Hodarchaeota archaeon]